MKKSRIYDGGGTRLPIALKTLETKSLEKTIKISIIAFMTLMTSAVVFLVVAFLFFARDLPNIESLKNYTPPTITRIFSAFAQIPAERFSLY